MTHRPPKRHPNPAVCPVVNAGMRALGRLGFHQAMMWMQGQAARNAAARARNGCAARCTISAGVTPVIGAFGPAPRATE